MPEMTMFPGTWKDILPGRNIFSPVSGWKAESYSRFACHRRSSVVPGGHSPRLRLGGGRWCVCEEWFFHVMISQRIRRTGNETGESIGLILCIHYSNL